MPPRNARSQPKIKDEDLDFDVLASQPGGSQGSQGDGSDDNALQLAFAEQLLATKAQKKKETQQKFVSNVRRGIRTQLTTPIQTLSDTKQSIEELLQAFIVNHATEEDNIRRIWEEILDEERRLQQLLSTSIKTNTAVGEECGRNQVRGMGCVKTVTLEYERVVDWIDPARAIGTD